jgi:hypothetical protein
MSSYSLTIQFTGQDAQAINSANQQVVLVKSVSGTNGTPVAWVTFSPFENNVITWDDNYGVYASTTSVEGGALIVKSSTVNPATMNEIYPFESGAFDNPIQGTVNTYGIKNLSPVTYTFGLAQSVTANSNSFDANPMNAAPVLPQETATFTPIETVQVFLGAQISNGAVITNITSGALTVELSNNPQAIIHYSAGQFVQGGLQ